MKDEIEFRWWYQDVRRILRFDREKARLFAERLIKNCNPEVRDWGRGFFAIDATNDKIYFWDWLKGWIDVDYKKWNAEWTKEED